MSEKQNAHILLKVEQTERLDFIAAAKTDIGPARWSRSACIREAVNEYLDRYLVSGDRGSYEILDTFDPPED